MHRDLKLAFRQLGKSPGFVVTAIVTLALGIGANAIVFSVLNALVLRPVNVPHADNLYMVQRFQYPSQSYPDYLDLRDKNRSFESLVTYNIIGPQGVDTGGNPSTAWPYLASGNYFDALEIQPYLGRFFHAADEKGMNSAPYVVLSYAYWHSFFHADPNAVGRPVSINKHPFTVIGVAPPEFRGTELFFAPAMWIPIVESQTVQGDDSMKYRGNHSLFVVGRLKRGVSPTEATSDLNALGAWLAKTYPTDDDGVKFTLARPGLVGDMLGGPAKMFMAGLSLLAGLILLAACANLGSLFAARAADRGKEVALRLALGSKRGLILRQLLTEAVMVSLAGGAIGLGGGILLLRLLSAWQPNPGYSHQRAGESGLQNVCGGAGAGAVERVAVWNYAGAAGDAVGSVAGDKDRAERGRRDAAIHAEGYAAGGADCHLRGAGDVVVCGGEGAGAVIAQQLWISAAECDSGEHRSADVGLCKGTHCRDAAAHAGCGGGSARSDGGGIYEQSSAEHWRGRFVCLLGCDYGFQADEHGSRCDEL
jgi:MacB-like periplasmic core domain/FtsX-like permease family